MSLKHTPLFHQLHQEQGKSDIFGCCKNAQDSRHLFCFFDKTSHLNEEVYHIELLPLLSVPG
jgi:hypothetical protein